MRLARKGFTLVELIVVIVVIGIIAAIAIAKFVGVKEAAYIASMKADLRNFALYEQFYATDNGGLISRETGSPMGSSRHRTLPSLRPTTPDPRRTGKP